MSYTLVDAQEMHRNNPITFEVPTYDELKDIKVGDFVKIGAEITSGNFTERFWCEVIKIDKNDVLHCTINNDLVFTEFHGLYDNDEITINITNVYSIYKK